MAPRTAEADDPYLLRRVHDAAPTSPLPPEDPAVAALDHRLSEASRHQALFLAVEYALSAGVEGHVAEFGTMTGATAQTLAKAMASFGDRLGFSDRAHGVGERDLWLFDSFEGLPQSQAEPDLASAHVNAGVWAPGTCLGVTPETLERLCLRHLPRRRLHVLEGWFSDTIPTLPDGLKFAVVHVDCDLYTSTMDVLMGLSERDAFADGCTLLFDEWDANRASPAHGERRAVADWLERYGHTLSDCGGYGWGARRFILHLA